MKYKAGDKVRIVSKRVDHVYPGWDPEMDKWFNRIMTIKKVNDTTYKMVEDENEHDRSGWYWADDMIAGPAYPAIVITTDGTTTTATLREGKQVLRTAKAVCAPDDTYDHAADAKLALERLMEDKPEAPTHFTGQAMCIEKPQKGMDAALTVGRLYTFDDGVFHDDEGRWTLVFPSDLDTMSACGCRVFVPLVER